jgi:hypothetical protein
MGDPKGCLRGQSAPEENLQRGLVEHQHRQRTGDATKENTGRCGGHGLYPGCNTVLHNNIVGLAGYVNPALLPPHGSPAPAKRGQKLKILLDSEAVDAYMRASSERGRQLAAI